MYGVLMAEALGRFISANSDDPSWHLRIDCSVDNVLPYCAKEREIYIKFQGRLLNVSLSQERFSGRSTTSIVTCSNIRSPSPLLSIFLLWKEGWGDGRLQMRDASYYGMDNMRRQRSYMIHGTGEQASLLTIQARERGRGWAATATKCSG